VSIAGGVAGKVSSAGQIADFTARLRWGALGRGQKKRTSANAALARGVGFVRYALPQSFQNPSNRSERSSV